MRRKKKVSSSFLDLFLFLCYHGAYENTAGFQLIFISPGSAGGAPVVRSAPGSGVVAVVEAAEGVGAVSEGGDGEKVLSRLHLIDGKAVGRESDPSFVLAIQSTLITGQRNWVASILRLQGLSTVMGT